MATTLDAPIFTIDDKILLRLTCIHKKVATDVFRFVFENDTSDRPPLMPLLDYYKSKGISGFKRNLNREQKNRINTDPNGATFDITLLYCCFRNGSCHLAPKDDDEWTSKDGSSIESLIGIIKEKRNNLAHEHLSFTSKQLLDEALNLKDILIQILKWCGKLYGLADTVISPKIDEVEENVKKYLYDNFEPTTFEEYKNELFFEAQSEYVNSEGVNDLQEQYAKECEDKVTTVNHLIDISLPFDKVYTEMKLRGESASCHEESTLLEEVLLDSGKNKTDDIVVISGVAGSGKTTFTKKLLHDWKSGLSEMKHLIDHNILLKSECRNKVIKCFDDLLHRLMPKVSKDFNVSDLKKVILAQSVLVMIDGLDELNKNSADLFEEILELKKSHKISLLITTRPEKLEYLKDRVKTHLLKIKHIELVGVPMEKRADLVKRYYYEISKNCQDIQEIDGLLAYLDRTSSRLEDLWKLPYNLTLITFLWAYDYMNVDDINTAPELYKEILELYKAKLLERIRSGEKTHHLTERKLRKNVDLFLKCLARESLIALKNNHMNIPKESYVKLEEVCDYINIPVEELTGAFLKHLSGAADIYSFPHKGIQDYLAALYIWMEVTKIGENIYTQKIMDDIAIVLDQNDIEFNMAQNILRSTKQNLETQSHAAGFVSRFFSRIINYFWPYRKASSVISEIMQEIHESKKYDISKFQNIFIYLIGLFYSESDTIPEETKLEALNLLQRSGIQNKDHWIDVLNSVKCDDYVASFISKQPNILDGHIRISDCSVFPYVSLMQALKSPLANAHKVEVDIEIKDDLKESFHKLFQLINHHQFRVRRFLVSNSNFKAYKVMLEDLKIPFVDAGNIKAEVTVDEDLFRVVDLLNLMDEKGIPVGVLKLRDIDINDSNYYDVISTIRSLPCIPKDANHTAINLDIAGDIFHVDELREVIVSFHFRIRRFLVNENNYEKYTQMLMGIMVPLKDTNGVAMEIMIDTNIIDLTDFLKEIEGKNLQMKKFKVKDLDLGANDAEKYCDALRLMSPQWREANTTAVDIRLNYHHWEDLETTLMLLAELGFRLKTISIRAGNVGYYSRVLNSLEIPFKDAQDVIVDIDINRDLLEIYDLLVEIKAKNFQIGNLALKSKILRIDDNNAHEYAEALALLPTSMSNDYKVELDFRNESSAIETILNEMSKHSFSVRIYLWYSFCQPMSYSGAMSVDSLKMVFERCHMEAYAGVISPELTIPSSVESLWSSIPDVESYAKVKTLLASESRLELVDLNINMSLAVNIEDIVPLNSDLRNPASLYIPKIATDSDIYKASEIARRLAPASGPWKGKFWSLRILHCQLQPDRIMKFLEDLKGVTISTCILFPASCRPSRSYENTQIQNLAETILGCQLGVRWSPGMSM